MASNQTLFLGNLLYKMDNTELNIILVVLEVLFLEIKDKVAFADLKYPTQHCGFFLDIPMGNFLLETQRREEVDKGGEASSLKILSCRANIAVQE